MSTFDTAGNLCDCGFEDFNAGRTGRAQLSFQAALKVCPDRAEAMYGMLCVCPPGEMDEWYTRLKQQEDAFSQAERRYPAGEVADRLLALYARHNDAAHCAFILTTYENGGCLYPDSDACQWPCLRWALGKGASAEVVELFLRHGARADQPMKLRMPSGEMVDISPLFTHGAMREPAVLKLLLDGGAQLGQPCRADLFRYGDGDRVVEFEAGVLSFYLWQPDCDPDCIRLLLDAGAELAADRLRLVRKGRQLDLNPLYLAVYRQEDMQIAKELVRRMARAPGGLEHGGQLRTEEYDETYTGFALLSDGTEQSRSLWYYMVEQGLAYRQTRCVRPAEGGATLLIDSLGMAVRAGNTPAIRWMLEQGCDPAGEMICEQNGIRWTVPLVARSLQDGYGYDGFFLLMKYLDTPDGMLEAVWQDNGTECRWQGTATVKMLEQDHLPLLKQLLKQGAAGDTTVRVTVGETAYAFDLLAVCAAWLPEVRGKELVKLLLANGANRKFRCTCLPCRPGEAPQPFQGTAAELAEKNGKPELAELIRKYNPRTGRLGWGLFAKRI